MPREPHPFRALAMVTRLVAEYEAGQSVRQLSLTHGAPYLTIRRILIAAGVTLRTRAEESRRTALEQHDSPLRLISADRWQELYWGGDYPSLGTLQERLEKMLGKRFALAHIRTVLREHGFSIRTPAHQLRIDGQRGRRSDFANYRFADLPPETQEVVRAKLSAAMKGKKKPVAQARKAGLAHRKSETRLCAWCGACVTRLPSLFRHPPERTACGNSHANSLSAWRRKHGEDAPRPLILAQLRELLANGPLTLERAETLGKTIGAGEAEIFALLMPD